MESDTHAFAGIQNQINSKDIDTGEIKSIKKIYKREKFNHLKRI